VLQLETLQSCVQPRLLCEEMRSIWMNITNGLSRIQARKAMTLPATGDKG
jgi:hypothetical protein